MPTEPQKPKNACFALLKHPLLIAMVSALVTIFLGEQIAFRYQDRAWRQNKRFVFFKELFVEGMAFKHDLSDMIGRRMFGMNRVLWLAKSKEYKDLDQVWDEYYASVIEWNVKLSTYKNKLLQYTHDPHLMALFYSYDDSINTLYHDEEPQTLHSHFIRAHDRLRILNDSIKDTAPIHEIKSKTKDANRALFQLRTFAEEFLKKCTESIYKNANQFYLSDVEAPTNPLTQQP